VSAGSLSGGSRGLADRGVWRIARLTSDAEVRVVADDAGWRPNTVCLPWYGSRGRTCRVSPNTSASVIAGDYSWAPQATRTDAPTLAYERGSAMPWAKTKEPERCRGKCALVEPRGIEPLTS
jgi:hypothetical protein